MVSNKEAKLSCSDKYFNIVFFIATILFASLSISRIFYSTYSLCDSLEHLNAAYFVQSGLIPYRDFLEHHNPLLWYIIAPLTKILEGNIIILPIARSVAVIGYFACVYLMYIINTKFVYGKKVAKYSTLVLISLPIWHEISGMRPDIFMMLCILSALYLFYSYLEKKSTVKLVACYTLLSISFLFLQKALFLIFGFSIFNLWYIYKKEIKIKDVIIASIVGLVPLMLFFLYLWHNKILGDYYYYNYTFNTIMREYYDDYNTVPFVLKTLFFCSFAVACKQYSNSMQTLPIFTLTTCLFLSLLYFFPHTHYSIIYFLLTSVYLGKFCEDIKIFSNRTAFVIIMSVLFIGILFSYPFKNERLAYQKDMRTMKYVNTIEQDKMVVPLTKMIYTIYRKPINYNWFGYYAVSVMDVLYTPGRHFDFNAFLKEKMPDYIVYEPTMWIILYDHIVINRMEWFRKRNRVILKKMQEYPELRSRLNLIDADFWKIDLNWIKENYTQIENTDVYKRNN